MTSIRSYSAVSQAARSPRALPVEMTLLTAPTTLPTPTVGTRRAAGGWQRLAVTLALGGALLAALSGHWLASAAPRTGLLAGAMSTLSTPHTLAVTRYGGCIAISLPC